MKKTPTKLKDNKTPSKRKAFMKTYDFTYTVRSCYLGYVTQAIVNNLAPLLFVVFQDRFEISLSMIGTLIFINFGAQLVVDALAVKFVDKIGYRPCIKAAHLFCAGGLALLGVLPEILPSPYVGIVIAILVYAVGGGLTEVLISPIVDAIPSDAKASAMSLLHAFYCWGQMLVIIVSTLMLAAIGRRFWFILPILWSALPVYNYFRFQNAPMMPEVAEHERTPLKRLFGSKIFLIALLLMVCAGASEQAMSQWSSLFAEKGLGVTKVMGDLLGPCLFALFMGLGRTLYGLYGHKLRLRPCLMLSAFLCVISYFITTFVPNPFFALIGCALCGLSVSLMWPGMFSFTSHTFPKGGTAMFGAMAICGDLGCSVGPWLTGILSQSAESSGIGASFAVKQGIELSQAGLKLGLLAAVLFPILMFCGLLAMRTHHPRSSPDEIQG